MQISLLLVLILAVIDIVSGHSLAREDSSHQFTFRCGMSRWGGNWRGSAGLPSFGFNKNKFWG